MSSPTLHLFPWNRPLVSQAVDWLAGDWDGRATLDLGATWVVVPTSQSGRRLREALAAFAAERGRAVFPPRVSLPVGLLEDISSGQGVARPHETLLAWVEVLRSINLDEFGEVFPNKPATRTFNWAVRLARQMVRLHETLAENELRIADVPRQAAGRLPENARWLQLARLEQLYDRCLRRLDLTDPQVARIEGIHGAQVPEGIDRLVVMATPDPQPLAITLIEVYAAQIPVAIIAYGPADEATQNLFDDWGRPLTESWSGRAPDWTDFENRVHLCANPSSQATRVVEIARGYKNPDCWLCVGTEDKELHAPLHAGLAREGFTSYNPEGVARKSDSLFELLSLLGAFRREPSFTTVEALARCPDVLAWLRAKSDPDFSSATMLRALDQLRERHLPVTLVAAIQHASSLEKKFPRVGAVLSLFRRLRDTLTKDEFPTNALNALVEIFGSREFDYENTAHSRRSASAGEWVKIAHETGSAVKLFKSADDNDAWNLALQIFAESRGTDEKPAEAIELQGWLELLWNDAPHLVIAGMNDGHVPSAIVGDAFLPESLREILGLKTNAARLARDCYILHALVSSRLESGRIDLLLGKNSASGDPLRPSRLLLICGDEQLPDRVRYLFREITNEQSSIPWRRAWKLQPDANRKIERLSVTSFRRYLECPFRFYLKQALRMEPVDPKKAELDALDFGKLCHAAVEAMGKNALTRESTDAGAIREFLLATLDRQMSGRYGSELTLPLQIQLESAKQRLSRAAEVQAALRSNGWVIDPSFIEWGFELVLNGISVRGTIDRIDRHESTGAIRVIDYKTSDKSLNPCEAHIRNLKRSESPNDVPEFALFEIDGRTVVWKDLQLPLYLRALGGEFSEKIECGYFNLPKATTETSFAFWENYTAEIQESADRCALGIVDAVKAGRFWPPSEDVDGTYDEFSVLFQHGAGDSVNWKAGTSK